METVELQPSLEQSLIEIIDSKLGKSTLDKSIEDLNMEIQEYGEISTEKTSNGVEKVQKKDSELTDNVEHSFDKTRLEFADEEGATCTRNVAAKMNRTVSALREKIVTSLGSRKQSNSRVELESIKKEEISKGVKNRKPMIVFLHGFGSTAEVFDSQLRYFSSLGYPCIAPDMLGHGFSSAPTKKRDYHFDKLLKDVDMILNYYVLKSGQKCVLVGHNYG